MGSLLTSYKETLNKFNHQENCYRRSIDEIPLLKLDTSQSIKREEEIQNQILQARQEFRDYDKKWQEHVDMLSKLVFDLQPKWLKDKLQAKHQTKTNSRTENALVPILPQVNQATPTGCKENKEPNPKLQVHKGSTSEVCIL